MEGCASKRMGEFDWRESILEKEEELCRALSNFSITLKEIDQFSTMKQLIKPPKLLVRVEKDPICYTRSLGALWAPTSRWRPFGPLDFVLRALRALRPCDPRKVDQHLLFHFYVDDA